MTTLKLAHLGRFGADPFSGASAAEACIIVACAARSYRVPKRGQP